MNRLVKLITRISGTTLLLLGALAAFASKEDNPLYVSGKIYVVVAVLLILFTGLVIYLIKLDRKVKKLEDK